MIIERKLFITSLNNSMFLLLSVGIDGASSKWHRDRCANLDYAGAMPLICEKKSDRLYK